MNYQLILIIWGAGALVTLCFILYKDFELITQWGYGFKGYCGAFLGAVLWPVTWFLYGLSGLKALGDRQEAKDAYKIRHGQKLRLGGEIFKVYRIGKDIKLKLIAGGKRG